MAFWLPQSAAFKGMCVSITTITHNIRDICSEANDTLWHHGSLVWMLVQSIYPVLLTLPTLRLFTCLLGLDVEAGDVAMQEAFLHLFL